MKMLELCAVLVDKLVSHTIVTTHLVKISQKVTECGLISLHIILQMLSEQLLDILKLLNQFLPSISMFEHFTCINTCFNLIF